MDVRFVASVSPIVRDPESARALFAEGLGIAFEGSQDDYVFTSQLPGVKHLGLWPLSDAAQSCFGTAEWPSTHPVPQASIEFEVDDVAAAAAELEAAGHTLVHGGKTEPWGQTVARLLTADGLLVAVCFTPWMREPDVTSGASRSAT